MNENEISKVIVGSAIIESVYEEAIMEELLRRGMKVERQLQVPII
jgi:hypothetical protein